VHGPERGRARRHLEPEGSKGRVQKGAVGLVELRHSGRIAHDGRRSIETLVERWQLALEALERGVEGAQRESDIARRELMATLLNVLPKRYG
jgi:hypothetical protein